MKKRKILYYGSIVFTFLLIVSIIFKINNENSENIKDAKLLNNNAQIIVQKTEDTNDDIAVADNKESDSYYNSDIVGRLIIENLNIDTVLTQSDDNSYYLTHNIYKQTSTLGNTFVDYRTDINNSKQINIYGHNSEKYNVPFKKLEKYLDYGNYENNKIIKIESGNETRKYDVFAVNVVNSENKEHLKVSFNTQEEWNNHFSKLKNDSIYETGVSINREDEILVIQTCLFNNSEKSYLIINAKKI